MNDMHMNDTGHGSVRLSLMLCRSSTQKKQVFAEVTMSSPMPTSVSIRYIIICGENHGYRMQVFSLYRNSLTYSFNSGPNRML